MDQVVRLKDVAEKAGVGLGTASRALNNHPSVKDETRKLVLDAAKELNYKANFIAKGLRSKYTQTVGVVIPDISSAFFPEVVRGIEDIADQFNYNIILSSSDLNKEKEIDTLYMLKAKMADGVIFLSNTIDGELRDVLLELGVPVVLVSTRSKSSDLICVSIDNEKAAFDAVDYLCGLGHRKIAMISGKFDDPNSGIPRVQGYKRALKKHGIEIDETLIYEGNYKYQSGYENTMKLLQRSDLPTAIFAASDEMAIGVSRAILESGKRIPEDFSVMGFDGIESAAFFYPSITTVRQPRYEMGMEAMRLLLRLLNKETVKEGNVMMNHEIIKRNSCKSI